MREKINKERKKAELKKSYVFGNCFVRFWGEINIQQYRYNSETQAEEHMQAFISSFKILYFI